MISTLQPADVHAEVLSHEYDHPYIMKKHVKRFCAAALLFAIASFLLITAHHVNARYNLFSALAALKKSGTVVCVVHDFHFGENVLSASATEYQFWLAKSLDVQFINASQYPFEDWSLLPRYHIHELAVAGAVIRPEDIKFLKGLRHLKRLVLQDVTFVGCSDGTLRLALPTVGVEVR